MLSNFYEQFNIISQITYFHTLIMKQFFTIKLFFCLSAFLILHNKAIGQSANYTQYVNPMIGTGGHAHTFPGATLPFGMMQLSPDTRLDGWDGCSGYHYDDDTIYGFTHTHLSGTGCSDYGDVLLMPTTSNIIPRNNLYASKFSHASEKAEPGFYEVFLQKPKVKVQLTTTARCGLHQYFFEKEVQQFVVLDLVHRDEVLDSELEIVYPNKVRGYRFSKAWAKNQKVFFEIEFSQPLQDIAFYENDTLTKHPFIKGKNVKAVFDFGKNNGKPLQIKVGISGVSCAGAAKNLAAELPTFDFEKTRQNAIAKWNEELKKVQPNNFSISKENLIKMYTALYHCATQPNIYNDVDGSYRGRNDKIYNTGKKFDYYTVFSIWDTYRAWNPLQTIMNPPLVNNMIQTFLQQYKQTKRLPVWELSSNETDCMIGYHAASIIWDAYSKGIQNFDAKLALQACVAMASEKNEGLQSYQTYGYMRADDEAETVSKTLEYAYDDWCIAQLANALVTQKNKQLILLQKNADSCSLQINAFLASIDTTNMPITDSLQLDSLGEKFENVFQKALAIKEEVGEYDSIIAIFSKRSNFWQNMLDPTSMFMRAQKNGTLYEPFSPYTVDNNYTEANSWQYSFYMPHHINGFTKLLGGKNELENKLDNLFAAKTSIEGRQQADITGLIGQYAHGNEPSHHIAYLYNYTNHPEKTEQLIDKICNEFYTTNPDGYIGNEDCGQMSAWYVMSQLGLYAVAPGSLHYEYNAAQAQKWKIEKPYASALNNQEAFAILHPEALDVKSILETENTHNFVPNPVIINAQQIFTDSQKIEFGCIDKEAQIFYKASNKKFADKEFQLYQKPFYIYEETNFEFYSQKKNNESPKQNASFYVLPKGVTVQLNCQYNKSYSGGGPMALLDGLQGNTNWKKGNWQGYQAQDFEAIIIYTNPKTIQSITTTFLQDQRSWIFYPTDVQYFGSENGVDFEQLFFYEIPVPRDDDKNSVLKIPYALQTNQKAKKFIKIKVKAKNYGILPTWHPGAGGDAFIFIDEIKIE